MSTEGNKALVRRLIATVWDGGNVDAVDDFLAPDVVRHGPPGTEAELRGRDAFKQFASAYRAAFPDLNHTIETQIAEGDLVVSRFSMRGTHRGERQGMAPTGRPIAVLGAIIDRVVGSRVVEQWPSYDALGLLQQLEVLPRPGQG